MKDFRLELLYNILSVEYLLLLDKFVSLIASCTLCIAQVESVKAEGVIRLTGGRPQGLQP
jgi:hypothetical protein